MIYHHTPTPEEISSGLGHVPNFVCPLWFEKARTALREHATTLGEDGTVFGIVRKASYEYLREVLEGEVTIKTSISHVGNSSAVCRQEAWQFDQLAIVAETILVLVDTKGRGKLHLSQAARDYLISQSDNNESSS